MIPHNNALIYYLLVIINIVLCLDEDYKVGDTGIIRHLLKPLLIMMYSNPPDFCLLLKFDIS